MSRFFQVVALILLLLGAGKIGLGIWSRLFSHNPWAWLDAFILIAGLMFLLYGLYRIYRPRSRDIPDDEAW